MATKKALLSKLKKGLATKRSATTSSTTDALLTESSLSLLEATHTRRLRLLHEMRTLLQSDASNQDLLSLVRKHISYFPADNGFHQLFPLLTNEHRDQLLAFISASLADDGEDVMPKLKSFVKTVLVERSENAVEVLTNLIRQLPQPIGRQTLLDVDEYVFSAVQFMPAINDVIVGGLVEHIGDMSTGIRTVTDLRHLVDRYVYDHFYDGIVHYLRDASISDDDKQTMTIRFLQDEFEGTQSQQLYLQIMDLVDNKTKAFHAPLQSLLYRFIADKTMIPPLKRFMEVVLDVVICNVSGPALQKHFPTRSAFEQFQKNILPLLPDKASQVIHARCREEYMQPFLYRHAHRVRWTDFLAILQSYSTNRLIPMEIRLYDYLQKHANERLHQILAYLNDDVSNIDRRLLDTMLERYIHTQPYKQQLQLKKLLQQPIATVQTTLENIASSVYVETMENMTTPTVTVSTSKKPIRYLDLKATQATELYRLRPFVPGFDHVAVRPFGARDNILKYMTDSAQPMTSVSYARVNDLFFEHLADAKISKVQKGTKFTMDGVNMIVANVTVHEEYLVQTEETWSQLVLFVQQQERLESVLHPLTYFAEFVSCPLTSHRPDLMQRLRERVRLSLQQALEPFSMTVDVSGAMEASIFGYAKHMGQYVQNVARVLALAGMPSQFRTTFGSYLRQQRINLVHLGQLVDNLEIMMSVIAPEMESVQPPPSSDNPDEGNERVQKAFAMEVEMHKRRILLDAYAIAFPTRRLPYLPLTWDRTLSGWRELEVGAPSEDASMPLPESWSETYLLPTDLNEVATQEAVEQSIVDAPSTTTVLLEDPLSNFLQVALDTIDEL